MDIEKKFEDLIPKNMLDRSRVTLDALLKPIRIVLHQRTFPSEPLSDFQLELLLKMLASLDTDKDPEAARVGEREARIATPLIGQLSAGFNHGIGRSGKVNAPQPKATGASLMQQVVNQVALDALRQLGLPNVKAGMVLPVSTGMSIGLVAAALRKQYGVRRFIVPRIDHSSPLKGLELAGMDIEIAPTLLQGDAVSADITHLENALKQAKETALLATTTFFPPRNMDPVKELAKLCQEFEVPLVINNAYGVQSLEVMKAIQSAIDAGRVDMIIQSGDKNFLTAVGSSILVTPDPQMVGSVSESYAGRASAAPLVQTLTALLALGVDRYLTLRKEQQDNHTYLKSKLSEIAESSNQRVLEVENPVAGAITLEGIDTGALGGRLYNDRVTGPRAVGKGEFGSCIDDYPVNYIVMNAAIGATKNDIEKATTKLYKELSGNI